MNTITRALLASAALAAVTALSACTINYPMGGGMGSPAQRPAGVNQNDMMFVTMMIPHHEQAVEMSDILLEKSGVDLEVRALAEDIKAAQGPEIELMDDWLSEWGTSTGGRMNGMDHGMGGTMTDQDLDALKAASADEGSVLYLEGMIPHHEGAIDMAEQVISDGENREVRELAEGIVESQAAEIALMEELLERF